MLSPASTISSSRSLSAGSTTDAYDDDTMGLSSPVHLYADDISKAPSLSAANRTAAWREVISEVSAAGEWAPRFSQETRATALKNNFPEPLPPAPRAMTKLSTANGAWQSPATNYSPSSLTSPRVLTAPATSPATYPPPLHPLHPQQQLGRPARRADILTEEQMTTRMHQWDQRRRPFAGRLSRGALLHFQNDPATPAVQGTPTVQLCTMQRPANVRAAAAAAAAAASQPRRAQRSRYRKRPVSQMTEDELKETREKNRLMSQRNRNKQKQEQDELRQKLTGLRDTNDALRVEAAQQRRLVHLLRQRLIAERPKIVFALSRLQYTDPENMRWSTKL